MPTGLKEDQEARMAGVEQWEQRGNGRADGEAWEAMGQEMDTIQACSS